MRFFFILFIVFFLTSVETWAANDDELEKITPIKLGAFSHESIPKEPEIESKKSTLPHSKLCAITQNLSALSIQEKRYPPYISKFIAMLTVQEHTDKDKKYKLTLKRRKSRKSHPVNILAFKNTVTTSRIPMEAALEEVERHIKIHFTKGPRYKLANKVLKQLKIHWEREQQKTNGDIIVHYVLGGATAVVRLPPKKQPKSLQEFYLEQDRKISFQNEP